MSQNNHDLHETLFRVQSKTFATGVWSHVYSSIFHNTVEVTNGIQPTFIAQQIILISCWPLMKWIEAVYKKKLFENILTIFTQAWIQAVKH
jgi:hypothetical protein